MTVTGQYFIACRFEWRGASDQVVVNVIERLLTGNALRRGAIGRLSGRSILATGSARLAPVRIKACANQAQ